MNIILFSLYHYTNHFRHILIHFNLSSFQNLNDATTTTTTKMISLFFSHLCHHAEKRGRSAHSQVNIFEVSKVTTCFLTFQFYGKFGCSNNVTIFWRHPTPIQISIYQHQRVPLAPLLRIITLDKYVFHHLFVFPKWQSMFSERWKCLIRIQLYHAEANIKHLKIKVLIEIENNCLGNCNLVTY